MSNKCIQAWISVTVLVLLAHFASSGWPLLMVLTVSSFCIMKLIPEHFEKIQSSRIFCVLQLVGMYLLISQLIPFSAQYWPGKGAETVVPATLLFLGIYGSKKRPERVAGILFWIVLLLAVPIILSAVKDVRTEWMKARQYRITPWVIPVLLLPVGVYWATGEEINEKWNRRTWIAGDVIWIMTTGILPKAVMQTERATLHEVGRSLTFGQYTRLESVISLIATLGWYSFISLMLYCAERIWRRLGRSKKIAWKHAIILLTLCVIRVKVLPAFMVLYIVFTWVIYPFFGLEKISKKREKNT